MINSIKRSWNVIILCYFVGNDLIPLDQNMMR